MKTWVEISESRLLSNYKNLANAAGADTALLPVIKADAYGHSAAICAPILARAGAEWLGIADAAEGEAIRKTLTAAGIPHHAQPKILVMCGTLPEEAETIVRHTLTPVVWEQHQIESLAAVRQHGGHTPGPSTSKSTPEWHARASPPANDLHTLLHWLKRQPHLRLEGILTHFAEPEVASSPHTTKQRQRFEQALTAVIAAGLQPTSIHAGNSSTLDNCGHQTSNENLHWLQSLAKTINARPMVRPGIALYGYCLPIDRTHTPTNATNPESESKVQPTLQPVLTWKTRILSLRDIQPGDTIGYNATYTAHQPMRIALLPVGYADGLRRELASTNTRPGGWVILHNQKAPIVGRISMNLTTVDVTHIPHAQPGDEVTLLGDNITADDHATLAHTISYEILCAIRSPAHLIP